MMRHYKNGGTYPEFILKWVEEYGPVLVCHVMHKTMVFTVDQEAVKELLVNGNHPKSEFVYGRLSNLFGNRFVGKGLLTETDHAVWSERRSLYNAAFHRGYLMHLMPVFNTTSDVLVEKLKSVADTGNVISMASELSKATLDIIGKVAFDLDINSLRDLKQPFPKAMFTVLTGFDTKVKNLFSEYNPKFWAAGLEIGSAIKLLRQSAKDSLDHRTEMLRNDEPVPNDILTHMAKMADMMPALHKEKLIDDYVTFFLAGHDTTANLMSFFLIELGRHPDIADKLYAEIDDMVGKKESITYTELNQLEYLNMCLKETLRLYPPAAVTFRDTRDEIKICGYDIPKGTICAVSPFASARLEENFPDPLDFNPERFRPTAQFRPKIYGYFPFSIGPRTCIGQTFAQIEAKVVLVKLLQNFTFQLDSSQNFGLAESTTLKPRGGAMCSVILR
ncbi:unnamed protein product [Owenia fusiformis]|uniref:Cytochrome P450 n=1 Tax=Owenia fusiformis TaxID=6347 RepID=A0A8S4PWX0_OWEFU|nr:unnamed protein product [Owenia fusiformis]